MTPRDPADALIADFAARLGSIEVQSRKSTDWASATFIGARHEFELFASDLASVDGFGADIDKADIALRHGFVADVVVTAQHPSDGGMRLTIEALTIDDR